MLVRENGPSKQPPTFCARFMQLLLLLLPLRGGSTIKRGPNDALASYTCTLITGFLSVSVSVSASVCVSLTLFACAHHLSALLTDIECHNSHTNCDSGTPSESSSMTSVRVHSKWLLVRFALRLD